MPSSHAKAFNNLSITIRNGVSSGSFFSDEGNNQQDV